MAENIVILRTKRIKLRRLKLSDAVSLHRQTREKGINLFSGPYMSANNMVSAKEYIYTCQKNLDLRKSDVFGIVLLSKQELIGSIGLSSINWEKGETYIGFWLSEKFWGRGIMVETLNLIKPYIYQVLGLRIVIAEVEKNNIASIKVLKKAGFRLDQYPKLENQDIIKYSLHQEWASPE